MSTIRARSTADIPDAFDPDEAVHRMVKERTLKRTGVLVGLVAIVIGLLIALQLQFKDVRTPGEPVGGAPSPTVPR
ncbi:MAG TPA: hypothetical protein VF881_06480 [Polyangiaceae bacterium]